MAFKVNLNSGKRGVLASRSAVSVIAAAIFASVLLWESFAKTLAVSAAVLFAV